MEDLLGIEVEYNDDGSIKLHQATHREDRRPFPSQWADKQSAQRGSLPYSHDPAEHQRRAFTDRATLPGPRS